MNCFSGDITKVLKDQIVWLAANDGDLIYAFPVREQKTNYRSLEFRITWKGNESN